jgi:hypothetical protein
MDKRSSTGADERSSIGVDYIEERTAEALV